MACSHFIPKGASGPLSRRCLRCGFHIDEHIGGGKPGWKGPMDDVPIKVPGKKKAGGAPGGPGGGSSESDAARIWQRLGGEFKDEEKKDHGGPCGKIGFEAIVDHDRYLQSVFPTLITEYARIADKGEVSWESFLRLFTGEAEESKGGDAPKSLRPKDLRRIFQRLDSENSGEITLENVIANKDMVRERVPELLTHWKEIDVDGHNVISWDEFRMFFGGTDEWLEYQFSEIVGLDSLKDQIRKFYRSVALDAARRERGHDVASGGGKYHMVFQGNPGTGKTSLGRLIARLLNRAGIISGTSLREVQREALVGEYVGQTAGKTQKEIEGATGGILFIDEAYRLSQGGEKDFGKEAIEQLMGAMNEPPDRAPVMVFAGYPADMAEFMSKNAGLFRRIPYTFDFPDYSCSDLAEIVNITVNKKGYKVEQALLDHGRARLADIIEKNTLPRARELMNGGMAERIFDLSKQALDARDDPRNPSVILNRSDILTACRQIPPPPEPEGGKGGGGGGAAGASDGAEVRRLRNQVRDMQAEITRLQTENRQLKRDLASKGDAYDPVDRSEPGHPAGPPGGLPGGHASKPPWALDVDMGPGGGGAGGGGGAARRKIFQIKFREWTDFEPDLQEKLNEARAAGDRSVRFHARGKEFEVDLVEMVQRSLAGGRDREIREIEASVDADEMGKSAASDVKKFFRALDQNGDLEITRKEMMNVLSGLDPGVFTRETIYALFADADADHDRKVTIEEFSNWLMAGGDDQKALTSALRAA